MRNKNKISGENRSFKTININNLNFKSMKRKRNAEKICSATPDGTLSRNKSAQRITFTAWERAVLLSGKYQRINA
jgi:hypothetical protein